MDDFSKRPIYYKNKANFGFEDSRWKDKSEIIKTESINKHV